MVVLSVLHVLWITVFVLVGGSIGLILIDDKYRSKLTIGIVLTNAIITTIPSVLALISEPQLGSFFLSQLLGNITIRIDSLSAWFIIIINFTTVNGIIYGSGYLKAYSQLKVNREIHWFFYILFHISMIWVCMFEHGLAFLISWELMSLSSLMLVIFEFQNKGTLKAGINYLVQMHLSIVFLTIGFIWLHANTGSFDFASLGKLSIGNNSIWIFILLFIGFAIKAGFIPFHTWLPHAHPAAPSHVSGVMSGVIVKLGIYGIFRILIYLHQDLLIIGEVILCLSLITAIYGIANAALTLDFKRMLAFCTIENIGIIGIGIGIGIIGVAKSNITLAIIGFSAALLHVLNHSLFKSLLFFSAGNVFQKTHTKIIDHLGGLQKKMPITGILFLTGAIAICGVPPFNGFVSEFLIYSGLFKGLGTMTGISELVLFILAISGLAMVGGISLLTFTKTYGVMFLGNPRKKLEHEPSECSFIMLLPQYFIVIVMLSIAIIPQFYFYYAAKTVCAVFPFETFSQPIQMNGILHNIAKVGLVSAIFILLLFVAFGIRWLLNRNVKVKSYETWGCGYIASVEKAQYTGRSYSRNFGNLFSFLVKEQKEYKKIKKTKLYPGKRSFSTIYHDYIDQYVVTPLSRRMTFTLNYFQFFQNGHIQLYVIYGLAFILIVFLGTFFKLL
jgi:formate hydrogenlyase subunit 3/multisubunit Na+/H+ antiporter MnhD subunit